MSSTYASGKCGCGAPGTVYQMTSKLWVEIFGGRPELRPLATATACNVCVVDWWRYASPLIPVQ